MRGHFSMNDTDPPLSTGRSQSSLFARLQESLADASVRAIRDALAAMEQELSGKPTIVPLRGERPLRDDGQSEVRPIAAPSALEAFVQCEHEAVAFARAVDLAPYSREARHEFFARSRRTLQQAAASTTQLAILDIVASMFDYAIDHERMPAPAEPLIWRLQRPVIMLALLDSGYLGEEPRSLRRLVEHLAAISVAFAEDLSRGSELHRRLETVVHAVETVAEALHTRAAAIARQAELEYLRAAEQVGQLVEGITRERLSLEATPHHRNRRDYSRRPGAERERAVTERIRELIGERLRSHVPDSVREFLFEVWLRHLRTAALRNGEESSEFRVAMQVVDDLIWSLEPHQAGSRQALAERIPPLIGLLTRGLREIGARDDEYRAFFDELFLIHLRRMRGGNQRPPGASASGSETEEFSSA